MMVLVGSAFYSIVKSIDMKNTQQVQEAKINDDVEAKKPLVWYNVNDTYCVVYNKNRRSGQSLTGKQTDVSFSYMFQLNNY